jgi:hypothetical protein
MNEDFSCRRKRKEYVRGTQFPPKFLVKCNRPISFASHYLKRMQRRQVLAVPEHTHSHELICVRCFFTPEMYRSLADERDKRLAGRKKGIMRSRMTYLTQRLCVLESVCIHIFHWITCADRTYRSNYMETVCAY